MEKDDETEEEEPVTRRSKRGHSAMIESDKIPKKDHGGKENKDSEGAKSPKKSKKSKQDEDIKSDHSENDSDADDKCKLNL